MQRNLRAGHNYRSNLSLVLLKEKRTKKLHKLVGRYDHTEHIKDVPSSFVFISVIRYASLCNTGRTVRSSPSRMAGSLGTHRFCRARMLCSELGSPGSTTHVLAASQTQNWEPCSPEWAHCTHWGTDWSIIVLAYFPTVPLKGNLSAQ